MLHTLEMKHFSRRGKTFFTLDNELTIDTSGLEKSYFTVAFRSLHILLSQYIKSIIWYIKNFVV